MPISVYAEHLTNINTLSIQVTLPSLSNKSTTLKTDQHGSRHTLTVNHDSDSATVVLPAAITKETGKQLQLPAKPTEDLTFRISTSGSSDIASRDNAQHDTITPWMATDMTAAVEIACRDCASVLIPRSNISQWKDLPSEGWAEMMEFWHCHKPDEPHLPGQESSAKGYSAASQLAVNPGVGFLKATSVLVAANDMTNIEANVSGKLTCTNCQAVIGMIDTQSLCYALSKSALSMSIDVDSEPRSLDREKWQACALLSAMESQGVRKFIVTSPRPQELSLAVWIFAPDLTISCSGWQSGWQSGEATRVVKIMWKTMTREEAARMDTTLSSKSLSMGALELMDQDFQLLKKSLQQSGHLLPPSSRNLQGWTAALLRQFTSDDVG